METWPNTTPIYDILQNLKGLTPNEINKSRFILEENLILTLGLLKRIRPDRIHRLDIPHLAKQQLETLIIHSLEENLSPRNSVLETVQVRGSGRDESTGETRRSFLFKQDRQNEEKMSGVSLKVTNEHNNITYDDTKQTYCPSGASSSVTFANSSISQKEESREDLSDSDSEDPLDEYMRKQWGISLPKEKGGSCPFIFQRMMIERRKLIDGQKAAENEKNDDQQESHEGIPLFSADNIGNISKITLDSLSPELRQEALNKCPHFAHSGRENSGSIDSLL